MSVFSQKKLTTSQAINIIGKQSMLLQRMSKDKICKINNVNSSTSEIELASSIILFEKNISTLKVMTLSNEIQNTITEIELLWIGYKKNILNKSLKSGKKTMSYNDIILGQCNKLSKQILLSAKQNKTYPYNFDNTLLTEAVINSNDLKYLSQKLAFYYSSYFFRVNIYNNQNFNQILDEIDSKIEQTSLLKASKPRVAATTNDLQYEWKEMKNILTDIVENEYINKRKSPKPSIIFNKCNKILKNSDILSRTYKEINDVN